MPLISKVWWKIAYNWPKKDNSDLHIIKKREREKKYLKMGVIFILFFSNLCQKISLLAVHIESS